MMQNVLITGTGRPRALGFNLVRRCLEQGDRVFACVRKPTDAFDALLRQYPGMLDVVVVDVGSTASVRSAFSRVSLGSSVICRLSWRSNPVSP